MIEEVPANSLHPILNLHSHTTHKEESAKVQRTRLLGFVTEVNDSMITYGRVGF